MTHPGKVLRHGIIVGNGGNSLPTPPLPLVLLRQVVELLNNQHHGINVAQPADQWGVYGPFAPASGGAFVASGAGMLVRVINGAGQLIIGTETRPPYVLDYGDWAFVPAGLDFRLMNAARRGMNLRFIAGRLVSSR